MKRKLRMILMLAIAGLWFTAVSSMAAITATSDDFDTSLNTFSNWVDVGTTTADIKYDGNSAQDWYDGDDGTYITNYAGGMEITGDGLLNDGGLRLDTTNTVSGDEAIGLTIGGTMESNRVITFSGNLYNDNTSYTDVNIQLWNLTDSTLLAESGATRVKNYNNVSYKAVDFSLGYTVQASDDGDTLQIRFRDAVTSKARDIYVDNFSVSSAAPSSDIHLAWDFNSDSGVLTNNLAQYDYTSNQEYVGSNAVVNTLAFNAKSSSADYDIANKGTGHENALRIKPINTVNADFGVYIQKLDYTLGGQNVTNVTRVTYSFDILGNDTNGNLDPTNWTVKLNIDNTSQNLNVSDAWFNGAGKVTNQTFTFVADDATWTSVTGSYDIAVGAAGSVGGIQISADNGGYTSGGGIFLDNIKVDVETVQNPATQLSWNFNDDGSAGTVLTNNLPKYDYTSDTGYIGSNAVVNTLAFNGRSTGTDYIIRDKGGAHAKALYLKTINTGNSDFGIYIQKLDMTMGGQSVSNITRVSWSFDILGYDANGNLEPTNWTVKVNSHNTDPGLNVSDAWYGLAALAQTFDFNDDSTGETSTDGTWTTITGSYDIAVGATGTVGGIQISTDSGGYTSAGGIFLDNISVTIESIESAAVTYASWASDYDLVGGALGDDDNDGLSNLAEYGLNGNPTNSGVNGFSPVSVTGTDGGTNWLYYIHPERNDPGLKYSLETDTDLVSAPGWTNANYEVRGTAVDGFGTGFNAVTNRISTDDEAKQFIKLSVEQL